MEFSNFVDRFNAVGYNQSLVAAANTMFNFPAALAAVAAAATYQNPYSTPSANNFANVLQQLPFNTTPASILSTPTNTNNSVVTSNTSSQSPIVQNANTNNKDYDSDCESYGMFLF
jgi:hypothetical protein